MTRLRTLVVAMAATLAGACSLIPAYERPAAPVPAAFPDAPATAASVSEAPAWRDYFADARLRELVELALANNRDLRIAALNIERARAQYGIQRADLFPSITANGGQTAQRLPADLSRSGEAGTTRQYSATVGFSAYELDFFGRIRSLNKQALEQYLGTEEARRSAQISLVAEVANAWLRLAADRERQALANNTLATRQKSYELTKRSFDVGATSALDLRQAQTLLEGARADAARYASLVTQGRNALALVVGAEVPTELQPQGFAEAITAVAELPAGVPSEVLTRRPDILQSERQLRAANASIGAARAAFFPRITLTAAAGTASSTLDGLFEAGSGTWSFVPQISLPIFEAGRLSANLEATKVQREIAVAQYEKAIQSAFREVADALADRATLAEQLDARRRLVEASEASFKLSEARYKAGIDSYFGLLDAQRSLYAAELDLIAVRQADGANRIALYKSLGGGWQ
ncbi:AdeC/AdeK/OprM family multidrug efflux complex outer membrane factor [Aromatoleum petrolei]|uniref:AdeC/AdeK/OprM family multidrug efflux complex outer membrane factor n=1 Tax=Aromatoleum petrolei TaxID=76116 RepID=A0ABX1MJY3_9RHOO|nr:AdeC/AdeK/OprM family multidrug efflux complex outer membrane factor [Aromatoleum petrolei]NMF88280.1 AdeC/AdeK/OprM family multidrug efflux complex outer membrane factor [Aromatoleum petrolei]QTQ38023.1 RND efflux system outer membrane lipoprotein, NodT family [Aromatoleum petrolei]